jgi:hypothetical protein
MALFERVQRLKAQFSGVGHRAGFAGSHCPARVFAACRTSAQNANRSAKAHTSCHKGDVDESRVS